MNLQDIALQIVTKRAERIREERGGVWAPSRTPVTSLGYDCERRVVYQRVYPEKAAPIGDELAGIFAEGDLHQRDVRTKLAEIGFEVLEAETNFRDDKLEITGTIDGRIAVPKEDGGRPRRVPLEIKSTSGQPPANEFEWRHSETPLLRRYFVQLQLYMLLTNEPEAIALFKNKITGEWTVVPVSLDYAYAESILQRAERIRDAVRDVLDGGDDYLPARLASREECPGCPFKDTICHPEQAGADPLLLAEDAELGAEIDRRQELDPNRKEFEKLDERLKTRFKMTAGERFLVNGRWLVEKKKHGKGVRIEIGPLPADAT